MTEEHRARLKHEILRFVARPHAQDFDRLAREVIVYQASAIAAYGRLVEAEGGPPKRWQDAPLVPTSMFRDLDLCAAKAQAPIDAAFLTSGTSSGRRGRRRVPDLSLYHAGMEGPFVTNVLAESRKARPWFSLIPRSDESSLSHMVTELGKSLSIETYWAFDDHGLDVGRLVAKLEALTEACVLLTTGFALVHLLDGLIERPLILPTGSRMMLTGGFKGRSRSLKESELLHQVDALLGIGPDAVVPEYGMTELSSQAYGRPLRSPPWLKLRVLDPDTLQEQDANRPGLLACFDLLNLDNISALLTSDLAQKNAAGGVTILGRAPGSVLRGCSLSAEELLDATR